MVRRIIFILTAVFAMLIASTVALFSSGQLATTINWVLPNAWRIDIPHPLVSSWEKAQLPHFSLTYQGCPLLRADGFKIQWAEIPNLSLQQATLDYTCFDKFPKNEQSSTFGPEQIKSIIALLPNGYIDIKQLAWVNLPENLPARISQLLASPSEIHIAKNSENLTAYLAQNQVKIELTLTGRQLAGEIAYRPSKQETHKFTLNTQLPENLLQLPENLIAEYQWHLPTELSPDLALQQGHSILTWQRLNDQRVGQWQLQSQVLPDHQLTFPFTIDKNSIVIEQGKFDWALSENLALRGFITSKITPQQFDWQNLFPIKTAIRLSLLSENKKGKGNVVINSPEGEWQAANFSLPVNIHGNIKQGNFILYSAVPLSISGSYHDPTLRFLSSALLRVTGKERFLDIQDLRFPLAGIRVNKQGINGRLQAIFRGESPDFKQIELHLDGYAKNFKAGALTFFSDAQQETGINDRWQWKFWGNSRLAIAKSLLSLTGRGNWHGKVVQLSELYGKLDNIQRESIKIPKLELSLLEPITFAYEKWRLTGGVKLSAPKTEFSYGGTLEQPTARLNVNGELENLNFKGEVTAGTLGPIRLFARRQLSERDSSIVGRLYWSEQPANVFQSLLPFRSNWVITHGKIRGETAFSANSKTGFVAGGHFSIQQGAISFPSGELKGIEFSLPYRLQNNEIDIGVKQALDVQIAEINVGLPITNAKLKLQGHYPYTKNRPLLLRQLSFNLLGGSLNIERFALPQRQVAYLKLRDIQFEQLLALAQYHHLSLTGKMQANLPFWLSGQPCYICGGSFTQAGSSSLKFTPDLLNAMKKSGYTEQLLTYLVNDSQIEELNGQIQLNSLGQMRLKSALKLALSEHQNAKINLNYNHQENLFDLWQLINYGSQFEQNIEHSIYQKLDNR
ncbi:hypothetical protein A6B43_06770 [Vespertiliibacter pulmonis]|nr:hypothetical protein A6B43_06770 [Vespertiliibacter pulmonis]